MMLNLINNNNLVNNNLNINERFGNNINDNYNFKYGQLTIENILAKYRTTNNNNRNNLFNTLNKFNINENNNNNPFMLTFQQKQANINPFNNLDKIILNNNMNNNNIIQKIKAKYLFNNDPLNNKITLKDKEISELEKKLNFYKNKLFSSQYEDKFTNTKLDTKNINLISNSDNNYTINSKNNQTINSNMNMLNLNTSEMNQNNNMNINNITGNSNNNINNDKSFSFKNNIKNNTNNINYLKESQISQSKLSHNLGEETINFSLSEDESGLSGYFKFKGSQLEEKDKEYNYNDVLPIINKVSKLKEIKEEDDNDKILASNIVNNVVDNIEKNDEDTEEEKYKNIMNKFREEDKENDMLYNQINNQSLNSSKNEKPKLIRKNSSDKDKKRKNNKIVSFEEFLSKENTNG